MTRPALLRFSWASILAAAAFALAAVACGGGGGDAKYPILLSDALVNQGRVVYDANCASCHGDATTPPPLPSAPPHTVDGHTWHHQDRSMVEWILDGVPLAKVMPRFRGTLSEDQARAAIAYIKTFWPADVIKLQTEGSAQYEKQLAEGP